MAIDLSDYPSMNPSPKESNRAKVVEAALEVLKAAASDGVVVGAEGLRPPKPLVVESEIKASIQKIGAITIEKFNPVKQYADWIEEALKVKAE